MSHHSFTQRALRALRPLRRPLSLLKGRLVSSDRATIISPIQLIICVALFIGLFNNYSFFSQVWGNLSSERRQPALRRVVILRIVIIYRTSDQRLRGWPTAQTCPDCNAADLGQHRLLHGHLPHRYRRL